MKETSFYTHDELLAIGFQAIGKGCKISRYARFYTPEAITLSDHVRNDDFCIISGGAGISIGCWVHIGPFSGLYGASGIDLEDFAGLSSRVAIYSESDDFLGKSLIGPEIPRIRGGPIKRSQ